MYGRHSIAVRAILLAGACVAAGAALADDYPNTESFGSDVNRNADWYKHCMKVKDAQPPAADVPTPAALAATAECNAGDMYYDTESMPSPAPADWAKVRVCAMAVKDSSTLTMLYANGLGVKRSLVLASKYACSAGGAPAEVEGRVGYFMELMAGKGDIKKHFDFCDHTTSGYMMGVCASIDQRINARRRDGELAKFSETLTPPQKATFDSLMAALQAFAAAHGDMETDQSGTARSAFVIEAEDGELDQFRTDIGQYEKGKLPGYTAQQFQALDKTLNKIYRAIISCAGTCEGTKLEYTTITVKGIRDTQKIWLKYRDAWVAFGQMRYPAVPAEAWQALLTERRITQLQDF